MAAAPPSHSARDRAVLIVRLATVGGVLGAVGLSWVFGNLAEAFFSGRQPAPPGPPKVPIAAAPVQKAPPVVTTTVHHPYSSRPGAGSAPNPPGTGPAPAPAPPPPPVCHSTPSHPC
jgi:hypothetical protein